MTAQTVATQQNYTPDQTAELVQGYQAGMSTEALAERFGKSVRSIVAKLSREGVYKPKAKAAGAARVTKAKLVQDLAYQCGVEASVLESLEKASMEALQVLHAKLM